MFLYCRSLVLLVGFAYPVVADFLEGWVVAAGLPVCGAWSAMHRVVGILRDLGYGEYQQGYEHYGYGGGFDGLFFVNAEHYCVDTCADVGDNHDCSDERSDERSDYGHFPLPHLMTRQADISWEGILPSYPAAYHAFMTFLYTSGA